MKAFLAACVMVIACSDGPVTGVQPTDDAATDAADQGDGADGGSVPCGGGCASGALCCANACVKTASCGFAVTSISPAAGWQNGNDWIQLTGSGFVPGMKAYFGDGRAPLLVFGPTSALVQTPPGVGVVPVRVVAGAGDATLPNAFSYRSGGLKTTWIQKPMKADRGRMPALAVLQDGRVLVAGGVTGPNGYGPDTATDTAEIFDRPSESLSPVASKMSTVRWFPAAVTLLDGRVLVVGGACWQGLVGCYGDPTKADLFDPKTGTFTETKSPLKVGRVFPRAALLVDGRVVLESENDPSIEIYDPASDAFTLATAPAGNDYGVVARLRDGRVLFAGGNNTGAAQLFDSDANSFSMTGSLVTQRYGPNAHTLPDGHVAVIGGSPGTCCGWYPLDSIELFDPTSGTFAVAPYKLSAPRFELGSALVRDGSILVIGGFTVPAQCASNTASVDQIDPVKGTVSSFTAFPQATSEVTAVTLQDGSVLVAGGGGCGATPVPFVDFLEQDPAVN